MQAGGSGNRAPGAVIRRPPPRATGVGGERERQKGEGFTSGTERMPQTQPHTLYPHSAIKIPVDSGGKRCRQLDNSELFPLSRRQF